MTHDRIQCFIKLFVPQVRPHTVNPYPLLLTQRDTLHKKLKTQDPQNHTLFSGTSVFRAGEAGGGGGGGGGSPLLSHIGMCCSKEYGF